MIWVNKAQKSRQVPIDHPDITAVISQVQNRMLLVIAVYIPCSSGNKDRDQENLDLIYEMYQIERAQCPDLEMILTGDFNRWDTLWGGNQVASHSRQGEGELLIDLLAQLNLQLLLPPGTITYQGRGRSSQNCSTIDLIFATERLARELLICQPHQTQCGSDHEAIETTFSLSMSVSPENTRLLFKNAPWIKITQQIQHDLAHNKITASPNNVNEFTGQLMSVVARAINQLVPKAKPSPYAKRRWSEDLSKLRSTYTKFRNQACRARHQGYMQADLELEAQYAKRRYFKTLRSLKKQHWEEFWKESDNIWQASKYMADQNTSSVFSPIPYLKNSDNKCVQDNHDIAEVLLGTFFPPLPDYIPPEKLHSTNYQQLPMEEITEDEIQEAIFAASPFKGAGMDGMPAVVWQKTWPVIKTSVTSLFRASVSQGILPEAWKIAKIIPLRKPQKIDYTNAESFRPISLLSTLSKALESVVARRLSFLVEDYGLLPDNHSGGRKKRSTVDALMILQEKIFQAWRDKKVLSLVTFDVKGAFNGVAGDVLLERLRRRRVPENLVCWIEDFLKKRQATITVNNSATPVVELQHAGLPQGSPLSPILFLFFNSDLVESKINKNRGAIAFIDDYSAWVTGTL